MNVFKSHARFAQRIVGIFYIPSELYRPSLANKCIEGETERERKGKSTHFAFQRCENNKFIANGNSTKPSAKVSTDFDGTF